MGNYSPKLAIIIPCYNEEESIINAYNELSKLMNSMVISSLISKNSRLVFVDDGSKDKSYSIISTLKNIISVKLSRNFGQQPAILAGIEATLKSFDVFITIDVDLQDDITIIPEMVKKHLSGKDVVLGVRKSRKKDSFIKRFTANCYYRLSKFFSLPVTANNSEFRLISKRVAEKIFLYPERKIFLRGIINLIGFPADVVYYERLPRKLGKTKYSFSKLVKLATDSIYSFSHKPIELLTMVGLFFIFIPLFIWILDIFIHYGLYLDLEPLFIIHIILGILLGVGLLFLGMSILGHYIGHIDTETKSRPRYFIEETKEQ